MPSKSEAMRARKSLKILAGTYPAAAIALQFSTPFQLLIATILSAQCTDERVNKVTGTLFKKYKSPGDYIKVEPTELETDIHSTGFYKQKAKLIRGCCEMIITEFGSAVPDTMEDLTKLPGVGRKTANIVLANAMGVTAGIAVDTHVKRLSNLLGFSKSEDPELIESDLMGLIPKRSWTKIALLLQAHGRAICLARKPNCADCDLSALCPSSTV